MFCRVACYQTQPQSVNEIARVFREQVVPLTSRQPGFKGMYLLTKATGELMLLGIWDTEAQANVWSQNPEHLQLVAQIRPLMSGAPKRDSYEVQAHAIA